MTSIRTQGLELQNITFDNIPILLTHIPSTIPRYIGFPMTCSPIPKQNSQKPTMSCRMANVLATLSTIFTYHPRSADVTVFIAQKAHNPAILDKSVGTRSKLSPPPPPPLPSATPPIPLSMLIISCCCCCFFFFTILLENTRSFPKEIRGDGGYVMQLMGPITFGRDLILKRYTRNFPMKVTPAIVAASRNFRIRFRVNDVHFVSGNWTKPFFVNID